MNFTKNKGAKKCRNSGTEFDFFLNFRNGTERNFMPRKRNGTAKNDGIFGTERNGIYL